MWATHNEQLIKYGQHIQDLSHTLVRVIYVIYVHAYMYLELVFVIYVFGTLFISQSNFSPQSAKSDAENEETNLGIRF